MYRLLLRGLGSLVMAVAGCSATPADPQRHQAWALGDDMVTRPEYHTAVDGFVSCMRTAGYEVTEPMVSPIDGLTLLYDIVPGGDPAAWNDTIETCNHRHLSHIEPAYLESHEHVMDPSLRQGVANCLARQGIETSNERNATEFVATTGNRAMLALECVTTTARALYPRLPNELRIVY